MLLNYQDLSSVKKSVEVEIPAGLGIPAHVHTREDEIFHITEGEIEFVIAGRRSVARPGTQRASSEAAGA